MMRSGAPAYPGVLVRKGVLALVVLVAVAHAPCGLSMPGQYTSAQTQYLMNCGGCHGIAGMSGSPLVPQLRDRAGAFLCTSAGRALLVELPNVAFANVTDAQLADVLNYVALDLGGASAPRFAQPYSTTEVRALRSRRLSGDAIRLIRQNALSGGCEQPDADTTVRRAGARAYTPSRGTP